MKLSFVTTGDIESIATSKRALGLANHLCDLGWEVCILMMDSPANRSRAAAECDGRVRVDFFAPGGWVAEVLRKRAMLRAQRPDYVYVCSYTPRNLVLPRIGGMRFRTIVEHSELSSHIRSHGWLKRLISRCFEASSVYHADRLVCASRYLYFHFRHRRMSAGVHGPSILYLPYAYRETAAGEDVAASAGLRDRFQGCRNIVYLGSLTADYGLFTMLEAMRTVRRSDPRTVLHLVGGGAQFEAARAFVERHGMHGCVHMPGYVAEETLPGYLSLADAFLTPLSDTVQDWARCPSKTYMYLPYGRPVFTCPVGESAELFSDERLLFPSGDAATLAERILSLGEGVAYRLPDPLQHTWRNRAERLSKFLLHGDTA